MVVREAEVSLLACQLLLGQGALALKVGGKRAGRDELKCSAAEVLREVRRELDAARKPVPRRSFAKRLQQTGRDRRERTGPKMKRQPPRRKKHVAPQPPRLKVLSAEQKAPDRSFKPQGSGGLSYYANMRYFKSRWNPRSALGGCRLCQPSLFQQGVVGAFAEGFGVLTSDFGVGKSQDLGS